MKHCIIAQFKQFMFATLLTFLSLGASGTIFAQRTANDASIPPGLRHPLDEFLIADAEPPLRLSDVQRTIGMLAAVSGGDFTFAEKDEFQKIIEIEWRANNQETKRFVAEWNGFADKLASLKKYADQVALKERAQPALVADLKKYPNDPKREIARRVYRRAHGANSLGDFKAAPKTLKTEGKLKDILGDWVIQTGAGANLTMLKFSFLADGRATFGENKTGQNKNCFVGETKDKQGTIEVAADKVKIEFSTVRLQRINSCQPSIAKPENLPAETASYTWQLRQDENEMISLCLTDANGKTACYRKSR